MTLINGNGVGRILDVLDSPALISVAKESGQSAGTVLGLNLLNMRQRLFPASNWRAVWLVSPDAYSQIRQTHIPLSNSDAPLFVPSNGQDVPDRILGLPVVWSQHCATLGKAGGVVLADLSRFPLVKRYPGVQMEFTDAVGWSEALVN